MPSRNPADGWMRAPSRGMVWRGALAAVLLLLALASAHHVGLTSLLSASAPQTGDRASPWVGLMQLQLSDRTEVSRLPDLDIDNLPLFSRIETVVEAERQMDPATGREVRSVSTRHYLYRPFGYVVEVAAMLLLSLEIAFWGTAFALLAAIPLSLLAASNIMGNAPARSAVRGLIAALRAIPELVVALFLVLLYGFGALPGVLALALHGAGFLGKFFADDIEDADPQPQRAIRAMGVSRLIVWRLAILPQTWPAHLGHVLYLLDRNLRMSTIIGLVGAGGIGQELKGRFDMFDYGHVGTIMLAILITIFSIEWFSGWARKRLA